MAINDYELMYVLRPNISEDQANDIINKYRDLLAESGAQDIEIQNRGKRRLAYEIQRYQDGIYIQVNYRAEDGSHVAKLERDMRLNDHVIRYLTLKLKPQKVKAAQAEAAEVEAE